MAEKKRPAGRAIVTFSRSWHSLAVTRSLGARGVEVVTADEISLTPGSLSRYSIDSFTYPSPAADPEGFLDALDEAIDRFRPADGVPYVLMPVHRESYLIARHRARFEPRVALAMPPAELIDRVRDKGALVEIAREIGLRTPHTWAPRDAAELAGMAAEIEPPVLVKVRTGIAGVGIEKVESGDELLEVFARLAGELGDGEEPPIVQELVPGEDYCVSALFDSGEARAVLTYRNLRSIVEGAPGAVRQSVAAPEPEAATVRLLEALGWHGIAEVDYRWSGEEGDPAYLIEVNPRFFGGLFQAIASNVDYPWMLYRLALGRPVEPPAEVDLEVTTEAPVLGFLATLREAAESATRWSSLEGAWQEACEQLGEGEIGAAIGTLMSGLKEGLDPEGRAEAVRTLLDERQTTVSQLFAGDDPKAAVGLLYPLAIFLRQGKISVGAVVGAEPVERPADGE